MADNVNHPAHYTDGKYETIEFIECNLFDYHDGNAIKYISRAGKKDPNKMIEDLEKAKWYIHRSMNKKGYDSKAITVHDYILDKKLSPELASVVALIEAGRHAEAEEMLDATIKDLIKKEEQKHHASLNINADSIRPISDMFVQLPYFEKVICIKSDDPIRFTVGKMYMTHGDRIMANGNVPIIFKSPFYSVNDLNMKYWSDYGTVFDTKPVVFIEYKGEA